MANKQKKRANGEGSVYFREDKKMWVGSVAVGYDENGRLKRKSVSGKTKTEALQKLKKIELSIYNGDFVDESRITIYNLAKQIVDDKLNMNEIGENTYYTYMSTLKRLKPIYNTPLQLANETQIRNFFQGEIEKYSSSPVAKDYRLLKMTFNEAVRRKIIVDNPMENIKQPKSTKQSEKVRALTIEEQQKLLTALTENDIQYSQQMLLSMFTGMRMGEVNALYKTDIFLNFGQIMVMRTMTRNKEGKYQIGETAKTEAGKRTIRVSNDVKELLQDCLDLSDEKSPLLFTDRKGRLIGTSQIKSQFDRVLQKYDIVDKSLPGKITMHSLRHTYATRMIEGGMQPKVLQELLGHTDITVTMNTYCDAFSKFQDDNIIATSEYLNKCGLGLSKPKEEGKNEAIG